MCLPRFVKITLWSLLIVVLYGELTLFAGGFYISRAGVDEKTKQPVAGLQRVKAAFLLQAGTHLILFDLVLRPRVTMQAEDLIQNLSEGSDHYFRYLDRYGRYASFFKVRLTGTLVRSYFDEKVPDYWFLVIGPVVRNNDKVSFVFVQKPFGPRRLESSSPKLKEFVDHVSRLNGSVITVEGRLDRSWTSGGTAWQLLDEPRDHTSTYTVVDATRVAGMHIP